MATSERGRRLPVGAEVLPDGGVHFRVWAPGRRRVEVVLEPGGPGAGTAAGLEAEGGGYFSGRVAGARVGSRYRFRLDGGPAFPDPAARFQPDGPHGPSQVIDPGDFAWTDRGWAGVSLPGQVLCEMHLGTFSPEGTWEGAARQLPELARAGVTVLEVMPVAEFPGRFGWGYDGVGLFAPTRLHGTPDDMRRFVDAAHAAGLAVLLDVVCNHLGPDGNYLEQFSDTYFSEKHTTEWGEALNFEGPGSGPVREFYLANAAYWVAAAPGAGNADALSGAGVCLLEPLLVLRRSQRGPGAPGAPGQVRVPRPVSEPGAPEVQALLPDPGDPATFERCKIDWSERERNAAAHALHVDLLRLRREDPVLGAQRPGGVDGAVLGGAGLRAPLLRRGGRRPAAGGEPGARPAPGGGPRAAVGAAGGQGVAGAVVHRGPALRRPGHGAAGGRGRLASAGEAAVVLY
jgi:hypothetical protein